jgi:lipid A 3-O-deacylase
VVSKLFQRFSFALLFFISINFAHSQTEQDNHDSFIYLNWANDLFVQTDYYFSDGIDLGYIRAAQNRFLFKQFDFVSFDHFSVVQDFFTPTNLDTEIILLEDRPYAAYLYGSYQKHLFAANQKLYLNPEIFVGIIGPGALGRGLQTLTHELSPPSKPPQGWKNQVTNDLALNLNFAAEKGLFKSKNLFLNMFSKARLGTIYTDLSVGGRFRFGKFNDFFQSFKNLTFENPEKWQLYFEIKPYIKLVGYNATLQGGVFNNTSPYTIADSEINRIVGIADLSLTATYNNFYFNGIFTWTSKEFATATSHHWITLVFGWTF